VLVERLPNTAEADAARFVVVFYLTFELGGAAWPHSVRRLTDFMTPAPNSQLVAYAYRWSEEVP
jgi:hypothetical protein